MSEKKKKKKNIKKKCISVAFSFFIFPHLERNKYLQYQSFEKQASN